jgi:NAD-dependent DNA ligase (contains BRCT domain type II)
MNCIDKEDKAQELKYEAFRDEVVVFTGKLNSMTRDKAMRIVRSLGGIIGSSVTRKTTILVTNMKGIKDLPREEMSNKFKKATDLKGKGQKIKFLNEEEFLRIGRLA